MSKRREPFGMHSSELEHAMGAEDSFEDWRALAAKLADAGPTDEDALEWVRQILAQAWDEGWTVGRDYALEVERGSVELAEREFYRSANPYR